MQVFMEDSSGYIDHYSKQFEKSFMQLMSTKFCSVAIKANDVYMEFINDRQHFHMNATIWCTLGRFVEYLDRTGQVEASRDAQERLWIQYIDNSPEAQRKREKEAQEKKATLNEEERQAKYWRCS